MRFLLIGMLSVVFSLKGLALEIESERVRLLPPSSPATGVFLVIKNSGDKDRFLLSAESSRAKRVELHTHMREGGMMKMRQVEKIKIPAQGKAVLKPGGDHIMLIGLNSPLKEGEKVSLKLNFDNDESMTINPEVKKINHHQHKHKH